MNEETGPGTTVAVIGGGAVGISAALFLQAEGFDVTLIDRANPGEQTSYGNAGVISALTVLPVGTPGILKDVPRMLRDPDGPLSIRWRDLPAHLRWFWQFALASRASRLEPLCQATVALAERSVPAWQALLQRCGGHDRVRWVGWLKVARGEAEFAKTSLERSMLEHFGRPFEIWDQATLREREPNLASDCTHGLWLPENGQVDRPHELLRLFAERFVAEGGTLRRADVRDVAPHEDGVELELADGRARFDRAVLAAGPWSGGIARKLGCRVPLIAERGYHLMLPQAEQPLNRGIYVIRGGYVLAPMGRHVRLTHGAEFASLEAPADERKIRRLRAHAARLVPGLATEVETSWMGRRPSTPDSLPVIGPAPASPRVVFAYGHGHIGLSMGPATGRLVADLIAGRKSPIELHPYRPGRDAGRG